MSDPTDPGGVGAAQSERTSRTARVGDGGSPVGSPLTIILSILAVVAGFLIFRTIDSGGNAAGGEPLGGEDPAPTTTIDPAAPTTQPGAPTTAAAAATADPNVHVVVINKARTGGVAGSLSDQLAEKKFTMDTPATAAGSDTAATTTVVYLEGANASVAATAKLVGEALGGVSVTAAAEKPAVGDSDNIDTATVFVILGTDLAGQELSAAGGSPAAPTVQGPGGSTAATTTTTEPA